MSRDSLYFSLQADGYVDGTTHQIYGKASELATGDVAYNGGYQEATAEQMFGATSYVESYDSVPPLEPTLIDGWLFQLIVIVGFVAYLYMLLRSWNFIGSIWHGMFLHRSERHMRDEGGELPLKRFKLSVSLLGMVLLALVVVRIVDSSVQLDASEYGGSIDTLMPLYAMFAVMLFVAWHYVLHSVVGVVTRSAVMSEAASITTMNFVRCIVLLYPLVTIWLIAPANTLTTWSTVMYVALGLMLLVYLKETFFMFNEKKISILHWILYLCAAILLPISFLCTVIPKELM